MPGLRFATVVTAAAILVAGCSGGSSAATTAEYQESVVRTRDRVDFALARITRVKSKDEFLNRMDEAAAAIDNAAGDLEEGGVAEGFEDETARLADALHQLSIDLSATATDIRRPDFEGLFTGAQGLSFDSWDTANRALASLIGQGIEVELIGRH